MRILDTATIKYLKVLESKCADVSKIVHALRPNGDRLAASGKLVGFSTVLRESLSRSLGGELTETSWQQAGCGSIGLGFRTAEEVALPAFVASRVAARPVVFSIFERLEKAGLVAAGILQATYQARTDSAIVGMKDFFQDVPAQGDVVPEIIEEGMMGCRCLVAEACRTF